MKHSDVKVGMRVAVLNRLGEVKEFGDISDMSEIGAQVNHSWYATVLLRKVKPKKTIVFDARVGRNHGSQFFLEPEYVAELAKYMGQRVLVTVKPLQVNDGRPPALPISGRGQ